MNLDYQPPAPMHAPRCSLCVRTHRGVDAESGRATLFCTRTAQMKAPRACCNFFWPLPHLVGKIAYTLDFPALELGCVIRPKTVHEVGTC
jgi:hypothetical protein